MGLDNIPSADILSHPKHSGNATLAQSFGAQISLL